MSKIVVGLDLDGWVYRCGFAAEKTKYLLTFAPEEAPGTRQVYGLYDSYKEAKAVLTEGMTLWTHKEYEPVENCLQMVKSSLENTLKVLKADSYVGFLSGRGNFRDDIYPDYKSNRDGVAKPKYYGDIRDYLTKQWEAKMVSGMEADDALGIFQGEDATRIVACVDKDLDQIPGPKYNWVTGESYTVSQRDGLSFFYQQMLSGDPTDNIPGLKGIGPKKAEAALKDCQTPTECAGLVYSLYRKEIGGAPDAIIDRNARLLWIWRKPKDTHPFWKHLGREPV